MQICAAAIRLSLVEHRRLDELAIQGEDGHVKLINGRLIEISPLRGSEYCSLSSVKRRTAVRRLASYRADQDGLARVALDVVLHQKGRNSILLTPID